MPLVLLCAHLIVLVPAGAEAWPLLGLLVNVLLSGLHIFCDLHHPGMFPACFQELHALGHSVARSVMHIRDCLVQTSWMSLTGQDTIVSWCLVLFSVQFSLGFSVMLSRAGICARCCGLLS